MIPAEDLLTRISGSLRHVIGPAVGDDYPRTQACMASMILEKTVRQVQLAAAHAAADEADIAALVRDLGALLGEGSPMMVTQAVDGVAGERDNRALTALVDALYGARDGLGDDVFTAALGRVRTTLRAQLDRRCEVAR